MSTTRLLRQIKAIETAVNRIPRSGRFGPTARQNIKDDIREAIKEMKKLLPAEAAQPPGAAAQPAPPPPEGANQTGLGEFISAIGHGMLETQRQLDRESEAYLDEIRDRKHILPSVFRVPKMSGKFHFALNEVSGRGVNLLFFRKQDEARKFQEQTVEFEMLAAPPPLEALLALEASMPRVAFILSASRRAVVFGEIAVCLAAGGDRFGGTAGTELNRAKLALLAKQDRILMFARSDEETAFLVTDYFVQLGNASADNPNHVGLWKIDLEGQSVLSPIWQMRKPPQNTTEFDRLHEALKPLWERQAEFLSTGV